jgi:L-2-hydroxyglutarate oxidase
LVPEIKSEHLKKAPAGIRAQAVTSAGILVDDFMIEENSRILNVCNAPSPAATASLNIGDTIVRKLEQKL